ncbi:hypothetical protein [Flavobacterium litorale]|uniref:Killer suppression protein HigA n=1 Tax=Flavobacterium litorale TaxID=2856519 RepID=A0ABX8V4G0_9FLAO|nr:hypothetical protein [Flavobacterium litorale]QYJ67725.1 hypothetical protein K1I41_09240 [Flavobacterium litorale]
MILSFENTEIRSICEDESVAIEVLGPDLARKLHARLADLLAVKTVDMLSEIRVGSPQEINDGGNVPKYKISLSPEHILIFCAINVPVDKVDWSKVKRVKILEIR